MIDWQEAYFDLVNKVECECVQQGDLVPIWDQFKRMSLTITKLQGHQGAMEAELAKFKALAETLAGALEKIAEGTYPRPLGKPWRMDASSSKHDRCIHDAWMYETCEGCLDAFVAEALRQYKEARDD